MAHTLDGTALTEIHQAEQEVIIENLLELIVKIFEHYWNPRQPELSMSYMVTEISDIVAAHRYDSRRRSISYLRRHQAVEAPQLPRLSNNDIPTDSMTVKDLRYRLRDAMFGAWHLKTKRGRPATPEVTERAVLNALTGTASRLVTDGSREVISSQVSMTGNGTVGYVRVTEATPCPFCALLATNGIEIPGARSPRFYRSDAFKARAMQQRADWNEKRQKARREGKPDPGPWTGSQFAVHNHCRCRMEPVYRRGGQLQYSPQQRRLAMEYAEIAAGVPDPWSHWYRWRKHRVLPEWYEGRLLDETGARRLPYTDNEVASYRRSKYESIRMLVPIEGETTYQKVDRERRLFTLIADQIQLENRDRQAMGSNLNLDSIRKAEDYLQRAA